VLEARIGKNYSEIIKDSIFKPLNMTHASVTAPSSTDGIVVGNNTDVFNWDVGDLAQ
jgi:CubicO group peptidase (beta-lactamase class C family)